MAVVGCSRLMLYSREGIINYPSRSYVSCSCTSTTSMRTHHANPSILDDLDIFCNRSLIIDDDYEISRYSYKHCWSSFLFAIAQYRWKLRCIFEYWQLLSSPCGYRYGSNREDHVCPQTQKYAMWVLEVQLTNEYLDMLGRKCVLRHLYEARIGWWRSFLISFRFNLYIYIQCVPVYPNKKRIWLGSMIN